MELAQRQKQLIRRRRFGSAPGTAYGVNVPTGAWFKADTLAALSNGANVTSWADSSLNGKTLTPVSTAPTFSTADFTPGAVAFSTSPLTNTTYNALNGVAGFTTFVVFKKSGTGVEGVIMGAGNGAGQIFEHAGALWSYASPGNAGHFVSDDTNKHVHEIVFDGTQSTQATQFVVLQDGTAQTLTFGGTIPSVTTSTNGIELGDVWSGGIPYAGQIAEVIMYPRALTTSQRSTIRVALGAKWGVTVTA